MTDKDTEYRELCARLRSGSDTCAGWKVDARGISHCSRELDAADAIECSQAEIAKLRAEFEKKREIVAALRQIIQSQSAELREHAEAFAIMLSAQYEFMPRQSEQAACRKALAAYRAWKERK